MATVSVKVLSGLLDMVTVDKKCNWLFVGRVRSHSRRVLSLCI